MAAYDNLTANKAAIFMIQVRTRLGPTKPSPPVWHTYLYMIAWRFIHHHRLLPTQLQQRAPPFRRGASLLNL
eukprot:scaffold19862_cov130-Isochrysis_galbana.AAC.2